MSISKENLSIIIIKEKCIIITSLIEEIVNHLFYFFFPSFPIFFMHKII